MAQILKVAALQKALPIIKEFEGCRLKAYKCPAGVWTIGYGETLGVKEGDVWTQERADKMLKSRVLEFMDGVLKACPGLDLDYRLAACTSLAYNIGLGGFARSSVCRNINKGAWMAAADAFLLWNQSNGKVLPGLTRRRKAERKLFLGE
ncbi:lysozyme [Oxalobacter sp. OttesenSCG-928-P03]|nr:lysozyme [Oxalobacter sp. OttesenSCG-928-P03]